MLVPVIVVRTIVNYYCEIDLRFVKTVFQNSFCFKAKRVKVLIF